MRQLVCDGLLVPRTGPQRGQRLMLHPAAPAELRMTVFLRSERIRSEEFFKDRKHVRRQGGIRASDRPRRKIERHVVDDRERIGSAVFIPMREGVELRDGHRHEIGRDRIAMSPPKCPRPIAVQRVTDKQSLRHRGQRLRTGDGHIDGIRLVGGMIDARPPQAAAVRFGE